MGVVPNLASHRSQALSCVESLGGSAYDVPHYRPQGHRILCTAGSTPAVHGRDAMSSRRGAEAPMLVVKRAIRRPCGPGRGAWCSWRPWTLADRS